MNTLLDPEVLKFLSLSLSPVIVIGIWVLIIQLSRKNNKSDDNR